MPDIIRESYTEESNLSNIAFDFFLHTHGDKQHSVLN